MHVNFKTKLLFLISLQWYLSHVNRQRIVYDWECLNRFKLIRTFAFKNSVWIDMTPCLNLNSPSPPLKRMNKQCSVEMVTKSTSDLPFASCLLVREWWNIRPLRLQTRRQGWVVVAHRHTTRRAGLSAKSAISSVCEDYEYICLGIWSFHGGGNWDCCLGYGIL